MPTTKSFEGLRKGGWELGEVAFSAEITRSDEYEPAREHHILGLFRTREDAKVAVDNALAARQNGEADWWGGDVSRGRIADASFNDGTYGHITDWHFDYDDESIVCWRHLGHPWNEGMLTLTEAAASLGVTSANLRGAIARGALTATKGGRDWFVTPREVERYRRENRRGAK